MNVKSCSNCVALSTRPRISFDSRGWCNACQWAEKKTSLDWDARTRLLLATLDRHRGDGTNFDCLVPVSGGKDGSYVAHKLQNEFGMNPLCVTVKPPLPLEVGETNLRNFIDSGFNHLAVSPHPHAMRILNRQGLVEVGFPYYGWLIAIQAGVLRVARDFGLSLIFYGEDGEVEYGGSTETSAKPFYSVEYMKRVYLENGYDAVMERAQLKDSQLAFFRFPEFADSGFPEPEIAHWSFFEAWDPYRNYLVAKENCGLQEANTQNVGTFTNFAQNDQALYALHTYLMYLKFGFGRANQDACIEIRRGAMDRQQAINLVRLFDGKFPTEFLELYLEYYDMDSSEFWQTLDRWANRDLLEKVNGVWQPKFELQ